MPKMTASEILLRACNEAEANVLDFLDCLSGCNSKEDEATISRDREFLRQLRAYRKKRWGNKSGGTSGGSM